MKRQCLRMSEFYKNFLIKRLYLRTVKPNFVNHFNNLLYFIDSYLNPILNNVGFAYGDELEWVRTNIVDTLQFDRRSKH